MDVPVIDGFYIAIDRNELAGLIRERARTAVSDAEAAIERRKKAEELRQQAAEYDSPAGYPRLGPGPVPVRCGGPEDDAIALAVAREQASTLSFLADHLPPREELPDGKLRLGFADLQTLGLLEGLLGRVGGGLALR